MPSFIERLARRVVSLETKVNRALTSPQLGNSSLEDGTLEEYDGDGQLVSIIGKQPDGTHGAVVVSGPVPPRPSAPAVSPGPGLLNYGWDGNFADEATGETDITIPAPMDWARVEAHASKLQGFAADTAATLLDTLESPRGGSRTVMLEPGTWFVKLVTRALSGKRSVESLEVSVEVLPPVGGADVDALRDEFQAADAALNQALQANTAAQAELAGTVDTLRGTELPALASNLADAQTRLDDAEVLLTDTFPSRFTAVETSARGAASTANAAQTAAQSAQTKADSAFTNAATAQSRADTAFTNAATAAGIAAGKGKVLVQNTAPGADDRNAQTLWIDATNNANTPKRWVSGTTWAAVTDKAATDAAAAAASAASAAATAKSAADNAAAAAAAAQGTANGAVSAAQAAQSTADTANAAAGTAQAKADTAAADALAAAGIANGKGKVLVQSPAPGAADRNAQTLWIDTTGGANTPKRWTTGTTWVAVTDKTATDAAAAAATAKSAADTAAAAAAAAQSTANAAQTAAGTAQSTANNALTMAGSKSKVYYDTAVATGTATNGDTWRRVDGSGNVIAEWRYSNGWVSQRITSDVISNLDVGKLTAGTANIVTAVAEKIAAATATFQKADIGNLTVTGTSALNTVTAQRIAGNIAQFLSVTTDQLFAGTASIDTAVMNKVFAEMFATRKLYANQVFIGAGGNLIPDPGFLDAELNTGRMARSTGTWTLVPGTATEPAAMQHVIASTNDAFQFWPNAPTAARTNEVLSVTPGQVYNLSVDITTTAVANCRWNAYLLKADGTVSYTGLTQRSGTGLRVLQQEYTIPAGVVGIAFAVACLTNGVTFTVHGNATVTEKVTPSLVVDGLMNGQRIVGASIETDAAANVGLKFTNDGLVAHGVGTDYDPVAKVNHLYDTRARITSRTPSWASFPTDVVPGLWFEATRKTTAGQPPPLTPAGLVALGAHAQGISLESSQQIALGYRTNISADQNFATMVAQSDRTSAAAPPGSQTVHNVNSFGWYTQTLENGSEVQASIRHDSDGVLRLYGRNGVEQSHSHAEFNLSSALASSGFEIDLLTAFTKSSANSSPGGSSSFATGRAAGVMRLEPGVYALNVHADCGASMGNNPAVSVRYAASNADIWSTGFPAGRWNVSTSYPCLRLVVQTDIKVMVMQNSGTSRTCSVRVNIEKLK